MGRLFENRRLVRNPKFCRFCANHDITVLEKGHRSKCEFRLCKCNECSKNAKKVQTSKNHRKKKDVSRTVASSSSSQDNSLSESPVAAANETAITLKRFIEGNLDAYFEDSSDDANDELSNENGHDNASSYIQSLQMICVDENMNEIKNFGSACNSTSKYKMTVVEPTRDFMVETLMTEYGPDIPTLLHALLDACNGDYAEAARRIDETKKKCQTNNN